MIEKPTVIITSLGRTGTKFFARFFQQAAKDVTALHEPDIVTTIDVKYDGVNHIFRQIGDAGLYHFVRKVFRKWSLIEVSDARVRGELGYQEAVAQVIAHRKRFVSSKPGRLYVESSIAYYGLLDVVEGAFTDLRSVYITRDGRTWVRSWMDWAETGGMYNKGKIRSLLAHTWPTAEEISDDPYCKRWAAMSRFEKLCWGWAKLNSYAVDSIERTGYARLFRFEDLFLSEQRDDHLVELVSHLNGPRGGITMSTAALRQWVKNPIHQSEHRFPCWDQWPEAYRDAFHEICGPLMTRLGYEYA